MPYGANVTLTRERAELIRLSYRKGLYSDQAKPDNSKENARARVRKEMASFHNVRPSKRPADAWRARVLRRRSLVIAALAFAAVTAVALSELASFRGSHAVQPTPGFLTRELGAPSPAAPLVRTPSRGVSVAIHQGGYTLATPAGTISLTADVPSAEKWTSYRNGASRVTAVGSETVAVAPNRAEHFQTILHRQGMRTWRWKLATSYTPSVTRGAVGFVAASGELMALQIDPVQILDGRGKRVTPTGLSWGLDRTHGSWWLTLRLDDAKLPLPYTIDPASTYNTSATSTTWTGTGTSTLTVPASIQANDLLVVQLTGSVNSTAYPTGPSDNNGGTWNNLTATATTGLSQHNSWRFAIASDASKTVTLTPSSAATGATVNIGSLHVFRGLDAAQAIATVQTAAVAGNAKSINCAAITPVAGASAATPEHLMCLISSDASPTSTYSAATGMAPWTSRFEDGTAATPSHGLFSTEVTANTAIGQITSSNNVFGPSPARQTSVAMGFNTDATASTVSNVNSSTANGSYNAGAAISIQITFNEPVTITGTPTLALNSGGSASYSSGSGTTVLTFTYTVGAGQTSADLDYSATNSLALAGGTIKDAGGNNATLTLPAVGGASSLGGQKALVIDTTAPTVSSVNSSTANGTYAVGATISIQVNFSENVTVTGTPQLALNSGATVNYASGSGTSQLTFTYTVGSGDSSADLDYVATTSLTLNGGTIKDAATNNATLTLPTVGGASSLGGQKALVVDGVAPTVSSVSSSTANGSYKAAATVSIQVNFSENVTVTGTPQIALNSGATVNYSSGSGTSTLTFTYTVAGGETSADLDYNATTSLTLNGGTIKDTATNAATLTLASPGAVGSLGNAKNIVIDTTAPTVSSVTSSTANGSYTTAATVSIQVNFSENVTATGTPQLALNSGATVNYASGSGTSTLTFTYTVAGGENSADLDYNATTSLTLNGGTIRDAATNNATLTLATPGAAGSLGNAKNIVIDTTAPTVSSVTSSTADGSYKAGATVSIQVNFSEPVTVTGTPQLALNSGAMVNYASGSGTSTLTFTYTVAGGENSADLDYTATTALILNAGTIRDAATNNATLTLAAPGAAGSLGNAKAIVIDTTAPTVSSVNSSTADGSYKAGATVSIQVNFSENVTVSGTPQIALNSGATVNYASGSGTSTLTFTYTVAGGENSGDLDYNATTSLTLNGGTIRDTATNNATLTLAAPGAAGSLGNAKNIAIDTTPPTVSSVNSSTADGSYKAAATVSIQVNFSENVTVTGTPQLALNSGATVNYASGSGTSTLTFTYTVGAGENAADLDYTASTALTLNGGTIKDAATNNATLTLAAPGAAGSLGNAKNIVIDTTAPTVSSVSATTPDGAYRGSQSVTITIDFSEPVAVTGAPTLALNSGGLASYSSGSGGSTLSFTYTIGAGENSTDLDYAATSSLALAGGTIKDAATNNATLTLPAVGGASSLGGQKAIVVDTFNPTATVTTPGVSGNAYNASSLPGSIAGGSGDTGGSSTVASVAVAIQDGGGNYWGGATFNQVSITYNATGGTVGAWTYSTASLVGQLTDGHTYWTTARSTDAAGNTGTTTRTFVYDTTPPTVTNVTSTTANGAYPAGTAVLIAMTFSEPVAVTGTPTLALNSGGTASYASGSGSSTLTFTYTVGAGENSADLDYAATSSLALAGGTIKDAATNNATLTLPAVGGASSLGGQKAIQIDTAAPTATVTTPGMSGSAFNASSLPGSIAGGSGDTGGSSTVASVAVAIQDGSGNYWGGATFNQASPTYNATGGTTAAWTYATATLVGQLTDGHTYTITARSTDAAGNTGATTRTFTYDTTPPTVTNVTSTTTDGAYRSGQTVTITTTFSEPVTVTGTPTLALNSGGTASYASGSGSSTLTFTYTVGAGENSADLDYAATSSLALAGGTIKDAATNNATLTLPAVGGASSLGGQKAIVVDTTNPTASFTAPGSNGLPFNASSLPGSIAGGSGDTGGSSTVASVDVAIQDGGGNYWGGATFNQASPTYNATGGTTAAWTYATATLVGQLTDGHTYTITARSTDAAGNTGATTRTFTYDTTPPTVTNVTSTTTDGAYRAGQTIQVQVSFSEAVDVTGTPTLTLGTTPAETASYVAGTGSSTLAFDYTVQAGDTAADLDYAATSSLALAGGTIKDAATNNATLTLPTVGGASSLGGQKAIVVDTTNPTESITVPAVNGNGYNASSLPADIAGSSADASGSGVGTVEVAIQDGSGNYWGGATFNQASPTYNATGGTTAAWTYATATLVGQLTDGHTYTITARATDTAGNASTTTRTFVYDATSATATNVTSSDSDRAYTTGETIHVQVSFSKAVDVTGVPKLTLNTSPSRTADYVAGSGTSTLGFDYTVQAGDTSADLDYAATGSLVLNGGTIRDAATNDATLTLPTVGGGSSLGGQKAIVVDTTAPAVSGISATNGDGSYKAGDTIGVLVTFTKPVTVSGGTPSLALNTTPGRSATYASGSGTATLLFNYTIQAGDTSARLDAAASNALTLNGATLRDVAANDADTTVATGSGTTGALANAKDLGVDTTAPTVTSVGSSAANGSYRAGAVIPIQIGFSENVTVSGTPQLALSSGATVNYASGSGTSTLTFDYTVASGENAADLDYIATTSLALNGGTIADAATNPATLTLAAPGAAGSLGNAKNIVIDTTAPTVSSVTSSTANGTYKTGATVSIQANFSENVTVTGTPQLALSSGAAVDYASGSGTSTLTFTYTVAGGENAADLDYTATTSLTLNGGAIADAASNNATLTLAAPGTAGSLGNAKNIVIDTTAPTVSSVNSSTADGSYKGGATVSIQANFSEVVTVTGTPQLALDSGGTASYTAGSGTSTLTFTYTVGAGDNTADLDYTATGSLTLNGGTIADAATNPATLTLAAPGTAGSLGNAKNIAIDTTVPTVTGVNATTPDGAYASGQGVTITVAFSEPVIVTGSPTLGLDSGGTASYSGGSGGSTLSFTYNVGAGESSPDLDYTGTGSLTVNGGTITDAATNPATLTLAAPGTAGSLGNAKNIVIDTTAPTVTGVSSSTADGSYKAAATVSIQVNFSEPVTVTGTPQLALSSGATVNYASGSGTSALTFTYTVGAGENTADLDYIATTSLTLNGGTIKDAATNNATLTLAAPGTAGSLGNAKNIVIDTTAPTVSSVNSSTANGSYTSGATVSIQVNFSENVTVTGTPQLALSSGATVNYASGSGTSALTFTYTVGAGDSSADLDYNATTSLTLNGGTIKDAATNAATLTLPTVGGASSLGGQKNIVIDTTAPTVSSVNSSTADGSYKAGATVSIQVNFSEAVTVTGTPQLALSSGATVNYASGSGTSTLTFTYTVGAGENTADLDYIATTSLTLNGGTIKDAATNNATLTLAAPGTAGSLGNAKNIAIDTTAPTVSSVNSSTADGSYKAGATVSIQANFSEPVTVTGSPQLALDSGGTASYTAGSGTSTLTFTYTVGSGENAADLDYTGTGSMTLNGGTIKDAATNNATLTLAAPGAAGSLGNSKNIAIDTTAPTVASVSSSTADGSYNAPATVSIQVNFSEPVSVTGTPQLALDSGGSASYTAGSATSTLTFTYTVGAGENAADLDYTGTTSLTLNGGTIKDAATNNATLTLAAPGTAGSLGNAKNIAIDTTAPAVTTRTVSGTTLDVSYSESLAGSPAASDFAVVVNGGSDTVNGVSVVGGSVVRIALQDPARRLDTVTVAYSGTAITDLAGNAAASYGAQAATNLTPNAAPDAPTLLGPADGVFVGSTTPTLSASFEDSDTLDFGKVVFEVCADSSCSASLGTFDSTSASLNVGQTGGTAAPGLLDLQTATQYWWRAKSVDSSSASSSFTTTRSFTLDTTPPTVAASASPGANPGFQYVDGSGVLWLNADESGDFTLTAVASDAQSGIAGVGFPAIGSFGGASSDGTSPYASGTYAFDGTGTPFASPGAATVSARNGVTVPTANTATDAVTIDADGAAPSAFSLGSPADATAVRTGVTVSAAPVDGGSGLRQVDFVYCDRTLSGLCVPSLPIGATQTIPVLGVYSVNWANAGLTDGHSYAVAAVATDNVGHTTLSAINTVVVDNSAPTVAVTAPNAVTGAAFQHYDAPSKTLWLSATQGGSFTLTASASDPDSGIARVDFPGFLGTSASSDTSSPYASSTYSFSSPSAQGAKTITAANGVTDPSAATSTDSITVDVDGIAPAANAQFPLNNGSYDNTSWNGGSAGCTGTPGSGICGTVSDAASGVGAVQLSIEDRTTGMYYDGAAFAQATQAPLLTATLAGSNWSYPLDQSKLASPHLYEIEAHAVDNVGNAETPTQIRFTYGNDTGPPTTTLSLTGATHAALASAGANAYNLYYGTALGGGGFTIHVDATDGSGVDTVSFPDLSGTSGFGGSSSTSTNSANDDPFAADSTGYTFSSSAATPPPPKNVISADLRGNSGNDVLTFMLDNSSPTGGSIDVTPADVDGYATTTSLNVAHLAYAADSGSGVASSALTVASASLSNGACGGFGSESPAVDGAFTATDGRCYRFTLTGTDGVGNTASVTQTVKVDTTAPSQPSVVFTGLSSGNTFDDGAGTLYYRPSAGGTFTVSANGSADAESGIETGNAGYGFSAPSGFAGSTQTGSALAVTFNGTSTGSGAGTVHATNNAGLDSGAASYTITADSTAPAGGSLTVNGGAAYLTSGGSVTIATTAYGDGGSGLASQVLTEEQAALAGDACGTFGTPSDVTGSTSRGVSNGNCYRFTLTATDNVGNAAVVTRTVKVDTTAPVAPAISFTGLSSGNTFVSGTTLFYRPSAGGAFTVTATGAGDPETGIKAGNAGHSFTAPGGFASTLQIGNELAVAFDGASNGSGAQSVSAVNNAGVASSPATPFTLTPDSGAPTGGALTVNPYSSSTTITIGKSDFTDAVSGIATNVVSRSNPQGPSSPGTCPLGGYTGATTVGASDTVPTDGRCYRYTLTGTDNVGNVATAQATVLVDTTGPLGGSVSYVDGLASLSSVSIDWIAGTDAESGIASVQIERADAALTGSTCGTFGSFAALGGPAGSSPAVDASVAAGNCYAYRIVVANNSGVSSTFASLSVAKISNSSPITVSAGNPAGVYLSGTTLWVGPAAANLPWKLELTGLGQNGVTTATWDGKSAATFTSAPPTSTVANSAPFHSGVYTWDGTGTLNDTIHVIRDPGATDDFVDVRSDTTDPGGSISYPNGTVLTGSVPVSTTGTDAGSGVADVRIERSETTLTGSTCGAGWSAFTAITLSGGNDTALSANTCYRYQVVVTDNVGNASTFGSAGVVQIPDTTPPTFLAAATNVSGTKLTVTMSEPLDATATTQASAFTVAYNGVVQPTPTGIAVAGSTVTLDLAAPPNNSEIVTVRYSQPAAMAERMRDDASPTKNETASFGPSAVVNNTPDTVGPSVVSSSVNAGTLTILFSESLAGAAPDPTAFTVATGSTTRAITNVAMSGKVVTLTIAPAVTSSDAVVVSYSTPALNGLGDAAANAVAPFTRAAANQTAIVSPPPSGGGVTVPDPALVSTSPDDGSTVRAASTVTLTANQAGTWTNMTLTRPDNTVAQLADDAGQSATWALADVTEGLYVVRGTLTASGRSVDVLSHFTVWSAPATGTDPTLPPVQKNAVPFAAGRLQSSDGTTTLVWPIGSFSDSVVVEIAPIAPSAVSGIPAGSTVVDVSAFLRSTHAPVRDLGGTADIRFANAGAGAHPLTSEDGKTWRDVPQLPTLNLPEGQADGWFRDSDGTVHVLARHLSYYALVGPQVSTTLSLRIITVRRLWLEHRSFIAVRMSLTAPARVTGSFVASDGAVVPGQTIRTPTRRAGVTILRVPITITKPGLYRLQLQADGLGQSVNRTAKIRFLATKPASPVWQDGAVRVAVVDGVRGLGSLGTELGGHFVVERVADAALYSAVDTKNATAAAVVVVDLRTIPAYTLAGLHALLPEVKIIGLSSTPSRADAYSSIGLSAVLPRGASAALVAQTAKRLVR